MVSITWHLKYIILSDKKLAKVFIMLGIHWALSKLRCAESTSTYRTWPSPAKNWIAHSTSSILQYRCSAVAHLNGPIARGSGHAAHVATWGCLLWDAVPYTLAHWGRFGTPQYASCSGVLQAWNAPEWTAGDDDQWSQRDQLKYT